MRGLSLVIVGVLFAFAELMHGQMPAAMAPAPRGSRPCTPQFAPLETGSSSARSPLMFWRKAQAGDWGGDDWLGWTYEGDTLVPVTLIVRDLPKERPDDEEEVTVESIPDVPFAMRCVEVPTADVRPAGVVNHDLLYDGLLRVTLGSRRYAVQVRSSRKDLSDARVVLSEGDRRQVLYSTDGFADEPHFEIEWAGDLDGDGELDLVANLSRKYSWHPHCLLLSSMASEHELVGQAACFETSC